MHCCRSHACRWLLDARAGSSQLIDVSKRTLNIAILADLIANAAISTQSESNHRRQESEDTRRRRSEKEEEEEEEAAARKAWTEEEEEFLWAPGQCAMRPRLASGFCMCKYAVARGMEHRQVW